jgi:hypothetical protein
MTRLQQGGKVIRVMSEFTAGIDLAISALKRIRDTSDRPPRANRQAVDRLYRTTPPPNDLIPDIVPNDRQAVDHLHRATPPPNDPAPSSTPNDKRARLAPLRERVAVCRLCPHLASSRTQTVFGEGPPGAEVMLIGEASVPGALSVPLTMILLPVVSPAVAVPQPGPEDPHEYHVILDVLRNSIAADPTKYTNTIAAQTRPTSSAVVPAAANTMLLGG